MNWLSPKAASAEREQFRVSKLQVFNWGTFSGLHDIPIAERGFLFIGPSGSGKSTLLDAFTALLVPPRWMDFNAAARESDRRDRNLISYIRGAWAEQKDDESGEIVLRYLRTNTTWSALALSYSNGLDQTIVLAQLFWLRGNTTASTDVRRYYLIFQRPLDLRELEDFGRSNFDIRKLKQSVPDAFARDEFGPYAERFRRLLGIESEMALRLLHKTQSAKTLGDLNAFLREFMLDRPATFEAAERLVSEFAELNAAHQAVVTAREQVQTLKPARDEHTRLQMLEFKRSNLAELRRNVNCYRETRRISLLEQHIKSLSVQADGLSSEVQHCEHVVINEKRALDDLNQQHREMGGDRIEQWEEEKNGLGRRRDERWQKRKQFASACEKLGWSFPELPQPFAELVGNARQEIEDWQETSSAAEAKRDDVIMRKNELEAQFSSTRREVEALQRQTSNIPAEMLDLRRSMADALGLSESALPFVGELIEVRSEESPWQGAIERVLHGFALSLLVDEAHYASLSNHVNSVHVGNRIVYHRAGRPDSISQKPIAMNSLIRKVRIKEGGFAEWLETELKQRFDYGCVENLQAFRSTERALTREGQVRHNRTRHEKDDRHRIDDRRYWVLGFDNREKLALFVRQAHEQAEGISRLDRELRSLSEREQQRKIRVLECQIIANTHWQDIDMAPLLDRISTIDRQIKNVREGNLALQTIAHQIQDAQKHLKAADDELQSAKVSLQRVTEDLDKQQRKLSGLQNDPALVPLPREQNELLDARFAACSQELSLDNLDKTTTAVVQELANEIEAMGADIHTCETSIVNRFGAFKRQWPADAADLDSTLASAHDFFSKLQRLETDGLPGYEQRFFELLQNQSHQNLAALSSHLNQERKAILERIELVNESLKHAQFNSGTYLHIDADDRHLQEVRDFRSQLQLALSHAWSDTRENAEARFVVLRQIVERLGSQEPEQRRWRQSVLDVRQHVEFIAREIDDNGRDIEVYRGGGGKSGGQREKLATTCLAAALRYQLGGADHNVPMYAPVVLDEAFEKADHEFTALAMNIFVNFGFQMIVATPLKSVMTIEPFIGGACFIHITERRHSAALSIEYDGDQQRLKLPENTHGKTSIAVP